MANYPLKAEHKTTIVIGQTTINGGRANGARKRDQVEKKRGETEEKTEERDKMVYRGVGL